VEEMRRVCVWDKLTVLSVCPHKSVGHQIKASGHVAGLDPTHEGACMMQVVVMALQHVSGLIGWDLIQVGGSCRVQVRWGEVSGGGPCCNTAETVYQLAP
jgi:hypothetical protein